MADLGKLLVVVGLLMAAAGVFIWTGIGRNWLGKLPGDIQYHRGNFSFYFPLATSILVSLLLTLIFWLIRKL